MATKPNAAMAMAGEPNCGTLAVVVPVPMTTGVLGVSKAVTGICPQISSPTTVIELADTHMFPFQYIMVVVEVTSEPVMHKVAVPAESPVMDRS